MKEVFVSIVIPYRQAEDQIYIWMQKRTSTDELNGKLEFPGGKIEKDETPKIAAIRETLEETGVKLESDDLNLATIHEEKLETKIINLYVFVSGSKVWNSIEDRLGEWYSYYEKDTFWERIPPANQIFLDKVISNIILNT